MAKLFDTPCDVLQLSMELHLKRHAVLTSNIANNETPNYRARELDFSGELKRALGTETSTLQKTNPQHLISLQSHYLHTLS